MPFVNVRITKEQGCPTTEQKKELIAGITELLSKVLNKNKASTVVIIYQFISFLNIKCDNSFFCFFFTNPEVFD